MPKQQTPPSGLELASEVSDLVAGAGMLLFVLASFALPVQALTALVAVALLIPALGRSAVPPPGRARSPDRSGFLERKRGELTTDEREWPTERVQQRELAWRPARTSWREGFAAG